MTRQSYTTLAFAVAAAVAAFSVVTPAPAQTKEVRVLCSNAIRAALTQLTPEIEKSTGRKLSIQFSASTVLKKEIDGGAAFDLTILTPGMIAQLVKEGKVAGGPIDVASSDLGVGVKEGSPKANIGSDAGMKARLLAAKTLTWTDGGAASSATVGMIKSLGIEDQLKPKIVLQKVPGHAAETVAEGQNELIFGPISEIQTVKGVEVLGVFPKQYQKPVFATAAVGAQAKDPEGAKALIEFLRSKKAVPAMEANGMKPAP